MVSTCEIIFDQWPREFIYQQFVDLIVESVDLKSLVYNEPQGITYSISYNVNAPSDTLQDKNVHNTGYTLQATMSCATTGCTLQDERNMLQDATGSKLKATRVF